ncbi:hypothetical protein [Pseudomonas sp. Z13]|uniref:hypothetical protein n=1 Tax=Pseudomonas sp. Z13 TaxID=2983409 RepID=UPI002E8056D0|nr:hypothetical protein [Pseudomonas sp. Z13]
MIDRTDWSYGFASDQHRVIQMKRIFTALGLSLCVASASHADDRFTFEKYPASTVSNKALTKVDWSSNKALAGQWRIKESIEGTIGKKADFAGHFVVATYGCGTGCQATVFVDVNDGKLYKAPMQFPSESDALAPANGGVAHRQNSNAIFMSDLRYYKAGSPDMMQNDGVVLWNEKAKKFELIAKSKPFLVKMD